MNKNIWCFLLIVSSLSTLAVGCAGASAAGARKTTLRKGAVVTRSRGVKAFVVGPAVVRAYGGSPGGTVYAAPAVSGTDADCARVTWGGEPVLVDQTAILTVGAGWVGCLSTDSARSYELLWRARVGGQPAQPATAWTAR